MFRYGVHRFSWGHFYDQNDLKTFFIQVAETSADTIEEDDIPAAIRSAKGFIGKLHVTEPNRKIPFHNKRINWPEIGKALMDISYGKSVIIEAIIARDDIGAYNMRLWRDLIADTSLVGRIEELRKGILFLKEQFGDNIVA